MTAAVEVNLRWLPTFPVTRTTEMIRGGFIK